MGVMELDTIVTKLEALTYKVDAHDTLIEAMDTKLDTIVSLMESHVETSSKAMADVVTRVEGLESATASGIDILTRVGLLLAMLEPHYDKLAALLERGPMGLFRR